MGLRVKFCLLFLKDGVLDVSRGWSSSWMSLLLLNKVAVPIFWDDVITGNKCNTMSINQQSDNIYECSQINFCTQLKQ